MSSTDGDILCDGYVARAAWTAWTFHCMFIQRSSQVQDFPPFGNERTSAGWWD